MLQKADIAEVLAAESRRAGTRRTITIVVGVVAIVVLVAGVWLWAAGTFRPAGAAYTTAPVAKGDVHVTLVATGTLEPLHEVAVTPSVVGTIASVEADYNQVVHKGQALAHFDMGDFEAALERSLAMVDVQRANRDNAAAGLADAKAALERTSALAANNTVSARELELARSALQRAEGTLQAAQSQLRAAEADLRTTRGNSMKGTIVSPIDGVVLNRSVEIGQAITSAGMTQPLFTIVSELTALNLEVDIDEADVTQVKAGNKVNFTVEAAPDQPFAGLVSQVRSSPSIVDGVVSYKGVIVVDNSDLVLKPGMTATAEIAVADALGVPTVPNAALRFVPAGTTMPAFTGDAEDVWVLRDGNPVNVPVTVGLTDGQRTAIVAGELAEGDQVITAAKGR